MDHRLEAQAKRPLQAGHVVAVAKATLDATEHGLGYGVARLAGCVVFSLGLIPVIVGGAELFTGNNLIVMAWASGRVSTGRLLRNWLTVYAGNFTGALATAVGIYLSRGRIASSGPAVQ
jgi:formate transporter